MKKLLFLCLGLLSFQQIKPREFTCLESIPIFTAGFLITYASKQLGKNIGHSIGKLYKDILKSKLLVLDAEIKNIEIMIELMEKEEIRAQYFPQKNPYIYLTIPPVFSDEWEISKKRVYLSKQLALEERSDISSNLIEHKERNAAHYAQNGSIIGGIAGLMSAIALIRLYVSPK